MKRHQLASIAAIVAVSATLVSPASASNGTEVSSRDTPDWVVDIDTGPSTCTGVLIDHEFVLTAAHCLFNDNGSVRLPSGFSVEFENGKQSSGVNDHIRNNLAIVPGTKKFQQQRFDLALLRLSDAADEDTELAIMGNVPATGAELQQLGYGRTANISSNGTLRTFNAFRNPDLSDQSGVLQIRPQYSFQGSCPGDSGGPIIDSTNGRVVGIHSAGPEGGTNRCMERGQVSRAVPLGRQQRSWIDLMIATESCEREIASFTRHSIRLRSQREFGTIGDDILIGTVYDDNHLNGSRGDDVICGRAGNDRIAGGDGDDILFGDEGRDVLQGQGGSDTLWGGNGSDNLWGGDNDDWLVGGQGPDLFFGGQGPDVCVIIGPEATSLCETTMQWQRP